MEGTALAEDLRQRGLEALYSELHLAEGLVRFRGVCTLSSCLAGLKDAGPGASSADARRPPGVFAAGRWALVVTRHLWGQGQVHEFKVSF